MINQHTGKNLTFLYSITLFAYWMGFAAISAFASMYLLGFQVSNTTIGMVIALANVVTAVFQPFLGTLSDKYEGLSARRLAGFFMMLVMIMAGVLIAARNMAVLGICLIYGIGFLGMSMAQPFINSIGMLCMNGGYTLDFGIARAAGSFGYAFCAYLLGQLAGRFGVVVIPAAFGIAFGLVLVTILFLPGTHAKKEETPGNAADSVNPADGENTANGRNAASNKNSADGGNFFSRYPAFSVMLVGLIGIYFGHILINNFTLQIVEAKGGGSAEMGTATSMAAVLELIMMMFFTRIMKKIPLRVLLRISVVFFTLKVLGSLLVTNMTGYYLVQLMQMFGWGIMSVGLVYYVNEIMEPEDCTKGQAYATMTFTIGSVAGAWLGGTMIDRLGVPAMLICGTLVSAIGAVVFFAGTKAQPGEKCGNQ